ncbi:MAG: polyisoprenoid-binding protein [Phycisphaerae bacterium]|nr:polyisoprenoid-binding protein [Phycisphaerae bacterium]|tara:strand:- start:410 stop:1051 length:642 start_codon:yes stop_codon:yes gene_type:complete
MTTFRLITICLMLALGGTIAFSTTAQEPAPEAASSQEGARTFAVDTVHSMTLFRIQHMGAGMFYGRFNDVTGTIGFDPEKGTDLSLDISIDINSIDSGHPGLDGHLKSPDFFNAVEFPKMTFKSSGTRMLPDTKHPDGDVYEVEGDLTIHGVTKKIKVEVVHVGHRTTQRGERVGLECIFSIKRSDYGMPYGVEGDSIGDTTRIIVSLEAIAQ